MPPPTSRDDTRRVFSTFVMVTIAAHLILGVALGLRPALAGLLLFCGARLIVLVRVRSESIGARQRASAALFGAFFGAIAFGATVFAIYLGSYTFTRERCEAAERLRLWSARRWSWRWTISPGSNGRRVD